MNIQRLRNWTTGRLHTRMEDIYEDAAFFTGESGIMTHQLPNAFKALLPWLREKIQDARFFEDKYDTEHVGEFPIEPMNDDERKAFWMRYAELPSLLAQIGSEA